MLWKGLDRMMCSFPFSFNTSPYRSGKWGVLVETVNSPLSYYSFHDSPNVFRRWKVWDSTLTLTTTPCFCIDYVMQCGIVLLKDGRYFLIETVPGYVAVKPVICYLAALMFPLQKHKLPIPHAHMHPHTIKRCRLLNWGTWTTSISSKNFRFQHLITGQFSTLPLFILLDLRVREDMVFLDRFTFKPAAISQHSWQCWLWSFFEVDC